MKKFISFSGGVESTAMCILYGKGAKALVADTGNEEKEMYDRWRFCEGMLNEIHEGEFEIVYLKPKIIAKGIECETLHELAEARSFFPSRNRRYCTKELKIVPIDRYLLEQGECELMIGLNADEHPGNGRVGNYMDCPNVTYTYPLYEDGLTRSDCIEVLKAYGLETNFPPYMQRGGCETCFFRTKKEAKAKYFFNKEGFLKDMAFEKKLQDKRKKFYGINMNFPEGYESVMVECEREISMYGEEQMKSMYGKIQSHQPCGLFCHR